MVVQHNLTAMNANRYLGINNSKLSKSLEKLSSGYAINRAGDNAAGLAVSEKMRSQIAGMTQAVKNAQDGISMVQTFEGALTETDSILQRMKVLANQSANGTYQDDVDRDAIQLEFDQLNDELNQIADTDFNGVVALNGGRMADGLQEVDGKFDYGNLKTQLAAEKQAKLDELNAEKKKLESEALVDIVSDKRWNSVGENLYQSAEAKDLWSEAKGLNLKNDDAYVDVTYQVKMGDDGKPTYEIKSAKSANGVDVTELAKGKLTVAAAAVTNASGHGGFDVTFDSKKISNPVFDATNLKDGDVVTLRYTGPGEGAKAPTQIQFADDSLKFTGGADSDETHYKFTALALTDADMNEKAKKVLDAMTAGEWELTLADGAKSPADLTKIKVGGTALLATGTDTDKLITLGSGDDEVKLWAKIASNKITISTAKDDDSAAEKALFEIDLSGATNSVGAGTVKFKVAADSYSVPEAGAGPDVSAIATDLGAANKKALDRIAEIEKEIEDLDKQGVSVSNAYGNAAIPMTYTKTITLQAGARSKDAVEFTFNYSSNGLGDLDPNMNCSARDGGLNTESLSLKTAAEANFAIDRIDHAINKVSMVRGTFGAIQNRLEHKIDNLNVSVENLTSAESQIRDTNMPTEMMNFTKQQILAQASQSMLAQANQLPQGVLSLLQ